MFEDDQEWMISIVMVRDGSVLVPAVVQGTKDQLLQAGQSALTVNKDYQNE